MCVGACGGGWAGRCRRGACALGPAAGAGPVGAEGGRVRWGLRRGLGRSVQKGRRGACALGPAAGAGPVGAEGQKGGVCVGACGGGWAGRGRRAEGGRVRWGLRRGLGRSVQKGRRGACALGPAAGAGPVGAEGQKGGVCVGACGGGWAGRCRRAEGERVRWGLRRGLGRSVQKGRRGACALGPAAGPAPVGPCAAGTPMGVVAKRAARPGTTEVARMRAGLRPEQGPAGRDRPGGTNRPVAAQHGRWPGWPEARGAGRRRRTSGRGAEAGGRGRLSRLNRALRERA